MAATERIDATATATEPYQYVKTAHLRIGARLKVPIRDGREVLLLAAGHTITHGFLSNLRLRGIVSVRVHPDEADRLCAGEPQGTAIRAIPHRAAVECPASNAVSDRLDDDVAHERLEMQPAGDRVADLPRMGTVAYDDQLKEQLINNQITAVKELCDALQSLVTGNGLPVEVLESIAEEALAGIFKDADLFAALGINPRGEEYPARHSVHVCMLALVIGARLGLDRPTLSELAVGCLVHDAGMLRMSEGTYRETRVLDTSEFLEITRHPIAIFDMLHGKHALPQRPAFIAYQMHERLDGSGYPRRRKATQIHRLSQIAGVADAYVGLVSPRPHRPALVPHCAIQKMLVGVRDGLFDAEVVRALLHAVSLYPLGSYVRLSDGRVARVIRSNVEAFAQPVVEAWDAEKLHEQPETLDLSTGTLSVIGPILDLESPEPLLTAASSPRADSEEEIRSPAIRKPAAPEFRPTDASTYSCSSHPRASELRGIPVRGRVMGLAKRQIEFLSQTRITGDYAAVRLATESGDLSILCRVAGAQSKDGAWLHSLTYVRRL